MADTQKKLTKKFAVITYVIAFMCLLAGLLIPLGPVATDKLEDSMLIMQLPNALGCFGLDLGVGAPLAYTFSIRFWGGEAFDLGALFVLLYALVFLIAFIGLFVVLFSNKKKDTSLNCAGVIEALSLIILSVLLFIQMTVFSLSGYEIQSWSIALVVAFGGTLLMLIAQSVYHKGSSGAIKTVLTIFSGITIVFCLFSAAGILPQLGEFLGGSLLDSEIGAVWANVLLPFTVDYGAALQGLEGTDAALSVILLILGILMIVNFFLDIAGIAKKTKRWMLLANLIRYALELILVLVVLILGFTSYGAESVQIVCYVLIVLAVLLTAINVIRYVTYKEEKAPAKAKQAPQKKPAPAPAAQKRPAPQPQVYEQPYEEPVAEETYYQPEYTQPQPQPQPQTQQPVQEATPVAAQSGNVYTPVIYNGPRDEFIDTLTNEQRIEFARTFLERRAGDIQGVPEYVVDGENDRFFQSLFIYYARVRGLVSDGLMNKFYEQVNAIKHR